LLAAPLLVGFGGRQHLLMIHDLSAGSYGPFGAPLLPPLLAAPLLVGFGGRQHLLMIHDLSAGSYGPFGAASLPPLLAAPFTGWIWWGDGTS
jgi:hypothetical protein